MTHTRHIAFGLVLFVSILMSFIAYFRVFATEAGVYSVGRAWYYFRDYAEFGFAPATLLGTILSPWISYPVSEPYRLAWQIQGAILLPAVLLVTFVVSRYVFPISATWSIALIGAVSLLPHMAYNLGNLDNLLAILAIVSVLALRHTWLVVFICVVGPLFHAMFVFAIYPCLLFLVYLLRGKSWHLWVVAVAMASMFCIVFFGAYRAVDVERYAALIAERAPGLVRNGAFEFFATTEEFFNVTWGERRAFGFPYLWFIFALAHVGILLGFTFRKDERLTAFALRLIVLCAPLSLMIFIADIYRLTAWVGFNVLLYATYLAKFQPDMGLRETLGARRPALFLAAVLPWMLLGPMGVTCHGTCGATAFPFFKRVIEAF